MSPHDPDPAIPVSQFHSHHQERDWLPTKAFLAWGNENGLFACLWVEDSLYRINFKATKRLA
jgi:hypothetical protein